MTGTSLPPAEPGPGEQRPAPPWMTPPPCPFLGTRRRRWTPSSGEARFESQYGPVTVRHEFAGQWLDLAVEQNRHWRRELSVRVGAPPALTLREFHLVGIERPRLGLPCWPVGHRFGWGGVFEELAAYGMRERRGERSVVLRREAAAARLHLRRLARRLHDRLDRDALRVARAFRPEVRFWIYEKVLGDPTGRVAQLARTCPGLLLVGFAHAAERARRGRPEHEDVFACLLHGAALGYSLDELVRVTLCLEERAGPVAWTRARTRLLASASPAERAELTARLRLLPRRAGPLVRPTDVTGATLPSFAPEDVPRDPVRNARWYRVAALAAFALAQVPAPVRLPVSRFVSRNALLIDGLAARATPLARGREADLAVGELVWQLAAYCAATGRRPARSGDPARFVEQARRWHGLPARRLAGLLDGLPALELGEVTAVRALGRDGTFLLDLERLPVPSAPEAARALGLSVEPIRSAVALAAEAAAMRHCVARLLPNLAAGDLFLYSVRLRGERLTLAVERGRRGGFAVAELRGPENAPPSAAATERVARWVERLR